MNERNDAAGEQADHDQEEVERFHALIGVKGEVRPRVSASLRRKEAGCCSWSRAGNLEHELENAARRLGKRVGMAKDVRAAFLDFARSGEAKWSANFRDLNAAVTRMATLAPGGRITHEVLDGELNRLRTGWKTTTGAMIGDNGDESTLLVDALGAEGATALDLFDRAQLACVIRVCRDSKTLSEAGRRLFAVTRGKRKIANDADRLRKYLARFGLNWPCSSHSPS